MKKRIINLLIIILILTCFDFAAIKDNKPKKDESILTIDRIFKSGEFRSKRGIPFKWFYGDKGYAIVKYSKKEKGQSIILKYINGKEKTLVSSKNLIPEGKKSPLRIDNYYWSKDRKKILIYTNSKRVWRRNTKGDYWVYELKTKKLYKIGKDAKPSTLMFAKFSPDGKKVAYVREHNIFTEDLKTGKIKQLTFDGSKNIINGTFDWVYEEEFGLRDGFRWSPDGRYIAFWQLDQSKVPIYYLIDYTSKLYPILKPIPYPKAGQTNSKCKIGYVNIETKKIEWIKLKGDSANNYIPQMDWVKQGNKIIFQYMNRLQNRDELKLFDVKTKKLKTILIETDKAWVDVVSNIRWINRGREFIWVSERDGYRHLYRVSLDGKMKKITKGDYDVISLQKIDEKRGLIYFIASPENPAQRYLYKIKLNCQGKLKRVTPANFKGFNYYNISQNGRYAFHTYSNFETPSIKELVKLPSHKRIKTVIDNKKLKEKIAKLKKSPVEFFKVNIGNNVILDGFCLKPPDFDPSKKYPVLFYVYGEPAGQTVLDAWRGRGYLWNLMLAQKGYIIMSIDNRGTPAPRGREWRKSIYKKIGVISSHDQAEALKKLLKERPYMDSDRIGIWGWSGGGSMTLNMMFRYPELYKVGMAVAPVPDIRYYDSIYQERYVGLPQKDPEAYKNCSPVSFAKNLKGKLLIVHGTGDDNVHVQGTYALINELVKNNKLFSIMIYPNRSHGIYEGKNTSRHVYETLTSFLLNNL
jgi:dipeptidyl-peptidase-4